jgi:hypothetical protein
MAHPVAVRFFPAIPDIRKFNPHRLDRCQVKTVIRPICKADAVSQRRFRSSSSRDFRLTVRQQQQSMVK